MALAIGAAAKPKAVVALDFGTTYSGFAFAHRSDPEDVHLFFDWPGAPRAYCKTQTSLFYVPGEQDGSFKLEDWSWKALDKFQAASRAFQTSWFKDGHIVPPPSEEMERNVGVFVTSFKLLLAMAEGCEEEPKGLPRERLVMDYLRSISQFITRHLREKYGMVFSTAEVQWCVTVPAIWSDQAKMMMQVYAEKAGLVNGKFCRSRNASMYPVQIILEPEAASFSCQKQLQGVFSFSRGDRFLVADVGGGTIDIVVHEKGDGSSQCNVHEVSAGSGALGGGTYVDAEFIRFLEKKIGCFSVFCQQHPDVMQKIMSWWLNAQGKSTFDGTGSKFLEVPWKLSDAWKNYDATQLGHAQGDDYYDEIEIGSGEMRAIFDTEVDKIIKLIEEKLHQVASIKYIFLVGGFSESPYLFARIKERFQRSVKDVLSPPNPGAAICRGAVALGMETGVVLSRISRRWYGISSYGPFSNTDPSEFKIVVPETGEEFCDHVFEVFVEKDKSVSVQQAVTRACYPVDPCHKELRLSLFSSESDSAPAYTTDTRCKELAAYNIKVDEDLHLDLERVIDITMCFGKSCIEVFAQRVNFGKNRKPEKLYCVEFDAA